MPAGCSSCHAVPGQPDRLKLGGGLAIPSPFGTFYAPNISPDPADGIGRWSEADFVTALRQGHFAVRHALLSGLSLRLLPACEGRRPARPVRLPENACRRCPARCAITTCRFRSISGAMSAIWKWLFMDGKPFTPDPTRSAQWNRGAYLVNGLGHCAECHSPAKFSRRHHRRTALRRRPQSGRRGLGAEHHAKGTGRMERQGLRLFPRNRAICPMATTPAARWRA